MQLSASNPLSAWVNLGADAGQRAATRAAKLPERGLAALVLIDSHPSRGVDWLYRRLGITQSGTVRLLDRLQSLDLITRARPAGQREVEITITAAGRSVLADGVDARARALEELVSPLGEREREQLIGLIVKALSGQRRERRSADALCRLCAWPACGDDCPVDASVNDPG